MDINKDIRNWVAEFVSKRNPDLNGFAPCPYAAKALSDDRVKIKVGSTPEIDALELQIEDFISTDVIVFAYNPGMYNGSDFGNRCREINKQLANRDIIVLDDHPSVIEKVGNVTMNNGKYALMFTQPLSKLDAAARQLAKIGYYKGWPEEYLSELFEGRLDPR